LAADFLRQFALRQPRGLARVPQLPADFWIEIGHGFINYFINLSNPVDIFVDKFIK
jgi:hypothetical protein